MEVGVGTVELLALGVTLKARAETALAAWVAHRQQWGDAAAAAAVAIAPPPEWAPEDPAAALPNVFRLIDVPQASAEFARVAQCMADREGPREVVRAAGVFPKRVVCVQRVQHRHAWEQFVLRGRRIEAALRAAADPSADGAANEALLKHGTRTTTPKTVCDAVIGLRRTAYVGSLGVAAYAAEDMNYCHRTYAHRPNGAPANHRQVLIVRASAGKVFETPVRVFQAPPDGFHSVRAEIIAGRPCFAFYDEHRAIPAYLVTYEE